MAGTAQPFSERANAMKILTTPVNARKNGKPARFGRAFRNYRKVEKAFDTICRLELGEPTSLLKKIESWRIKDGSFNIAADMGSAATLIINRKERILEALKLVEDRAMELHSSYQGKQPFFSRFKFSENQKKPPAVGLLIYSAGTIFIGSCIAISASMSGSLSTAILSGLSYAITLFGIGFFAIKLVSLISSWNNVKSVVERKTGTKIQMPKHENIFRRISSTIFSVAPEHAAGLRNAYFFIASGFAAMAGIFFSNPAIHPMPKIFASVLALAFLEAGLYQNLFTKEKVPASPEKQV